MRNVATMAELYQQFKSNDITYMCDVVEMIVEEKQALSWEDDSGELSFYIQPKYKKSLDRHVQAFRDKRKQDNQWILP